MTEALALLGAGVVAGWTGRWAFEEFRRALWAQRGRQRARALAAATYRPGSGISEWEDTPTAAPATIERYRRQSTRDDLYAVRTPGEAAPTTVDLPAITDDDIEAWNEALEPTEPGYHRRLPRKP